MLIWGSVGMAVDIAIVSKCSRCDLFHPISN